MQKAKTARRVSSETRANGLYALELRKRGPRFSIEKDQKKEQSKKACRGVYKFIKNMCVRPFRAIWPEG